MTRIVIKEFIWDEVNIEHIKMHNVSPEDVEKAKEIIYHRRTYGGKYLMTGRSGNRLLTIIIRRKAIGTYYVVTARDASKKKGDRSMKKKRVSNIPVFKTYKEEAHFWDTHAITDFEDETEDVAIIFDLKKPRDKTLVVRLQEEVKKQLEHIARKKGLNVSTLARMWLLEKLQAVK